MTWGLIHPFFPSPFRTEFTNEFESLGLQFGNGLKFSTYIKMSPAFRTILPCTFQVVCVPKGDSCSDDCEIHVYFSFQRHRPCPIRTIVRRTLRLRLVRHHTALPAIMRSRMACSGKTMSCPGSLRASKRYGTQPSQSGLHTRTAKLNRTGFRFFC
jgi:hypothetical protein